MIGEKHIFISYAFADGKKYAERLDEDLRQLGFKTWRDTRSIDEYQDFSAEIELGIQRSSHVVVCVTPSIEANSSSFVRREIIYAQSKNKPIIPLLFPGATLPVLINHLTWISFCNKQNRLDYKTGLNALLERLEQPHTIIRSDTQYTYIDEYLHGLYDEIVSYLEQTVLFFIPLKSKSDPEAVEQKRSLPMAFWSTTGKRKPKVAPEEFTNFHAAFGKYNGSVMLLGAPGAGKTTTLFAFARDKVAERIADTTKLIPFLAPIATWDPSEDLIQWLAKLFPRFPNTVIEDTINSGKALLLLDGIDELFRQSEIMGERKYFEVGIRFLELLTKVPAGNQVVVTCRDKDYQEIGQKAQLRGAVLLRPLDDDQMRSYLFDLPDLWTALATTSDLREAVRTPLLCSAAEKLDRIRPGLREYSALPAPVPQTPPV